jgi:predicted nucleic acid-binding protein
MLIYCDSVILIYFFDHSGAFQARAAQRLAALRIAGDRVVISDLIRLECRVMPLHLHDSAKLALFDGFFAQTNVEKASLTSSVFDRATIIRADFGFKTFDAINLAAAVEHGCDRFLTNDAQLARFPDITVEILP